MHNLTKLVVKHIFPRTHQHHIQHKPPALTECEDLPATPNQTMAKINQEDKDQTNPANLREDFPHNITNRQKNRGRGKYKPQPQKTHPRGIREGTLQE
jgi:hypothetical protein